MIDPLISTETAAAALALYREHRGDRPVTGVIYTHCHIDHFGGVRGVVTDEEVDGGRADHRAGGFLEHAVSENVYAGTAMAPPRRYMYGALLEPRPDGPGRRRPRADDLDRHRDADPADARHHRTPGRRRPSTACGSSSR